MITPAAHCSCFKIGHELRFKKTDLETILRSLLATNAIVVSGARPGDAIRVIKERIYVATGIPPHSQRLTIQGEELRDDALLAEVGIWDGSDLVFAVPFERPAIDASDTDGPNEAP